MIGDARMTRPRLNFAVWRNDIQAYVAAFPTRQLAEAWVSDCSAFPEACDVIDFSDGIYRRANGRRMRRRQIVEAAR